MDASDEDTKEGSSGTIDPTSEGLSPTTHNPTEDGPEERNTLEDIIQLLNKGSLQEKDSDKDSKGSKDLDSRDFEEEEEEVPRGEKMLLIDSLRRRTEDRGGADEWLDDDDTGYVVVGLSEEEFYDFEEETSARILAERRDHAREQESQRIKKQEQEKEQQEKEKQEKEQEQQQREQQQQEQEQQEQKLEKTNPDSRTPPKPTPSTPKSSSSKEDCEESRGRRTFSSEDAAGVMWKALSGLTSVFSGSEKEKKEALPDPPSEEMPLVSLSRQISMNSTKPDAQYEYQSDKFPPAPPADLPPPEASKRQSVGERRRSEIMGQQQFMGVDGQHCFFNLKVIFEPYKTGFEENKDLQHPKGTIIAGRFEVHELLGQAAFSSALQCIDLAAEEDEAQWVCLKVIKNNKDFFDQSLDEIKLLQYINSNGDPDEHHVLRLIDFFYAQEHLFIVSELLKENLYEFGRFLRESDNEPYYTIPRLKRITKQVLEALVFIHSLRLIHCDIKPENIVIKSFSRCEVKLIDFGSSCFASDHLTTYIQSRSYRAPEVILGLPYDHRIDIWSLGAVLAELHTSYVLFQNDSVPTMLARIAGILGPFPQHVLTRGRDTGKYFSLSNVAYDRDEKGQFQLIFPKKTDLRARGGTEDDKFEDFVRLMLHLDPSVRPTAEEALQHPWLA
ncbi:kinase-like domain-containing protein, partial [Ochromonadaceae sp. CCMP2298]